MEDVASLPAHEAVFEEVSTVHMAEKLQEALHSNMLPPATMTTRW